jgi:ABC-type multidrug transport system ATPase subunit
VNNKDIVLQAIDLAVSYGDTTALSSSSFAVGAGELVAVVGPNGAGKSTLFKALAGFVDHDGDVDILTFDMVGEHMKYHKNMSMELYGNADSLIYVLNYG